MILFINKIPEGRSTLCQNVDIEEARKEVIPPIQDLICKAEIDRIKTRITVHINYQVIMRLECSRCLREFSFPLNGNFFITLKNKSEGKNRPINGEEEEDCDYHFNDTTEEIDIRSTVFDEIILSVPMKPLCRETCPGFSHPSEIKSAPPRNHVVDPRWHILEKIKAGEAVINSQKQNNN